MALTITDPAVAAAMAAAPHPQNVYGPDGRLLGQFQPAIPGMRFPELGITDEELDRRLNDPDGWVTAEEVNAKLRELRGQG